MTSAEVDREPLRRIETTGLAVLAGFTLVALTGYALFALRPANLAAIPIAAGFFPVSFRFFAQIHIVLCFAALATILVTRIGWSWLPALAATYVVSFVSEHLGTGYGIPFGGYEYTTLLGIRVGPRVPALIPLSWFLMSVPCWVLAWAAFPDRRAARVTLAALGLVLWDLALDPAMSSLTSYWRWHESGPYYGMPWMNLVGWFVTGLALMIVLEAFAGRIRFDRLPVPLMAAYYGIVLLMPLGMLAAAGAWLGVITTLAAIGLVVAVVRLLRSSPTAPSGRGSDALPTPAGSR